MSRTRTRVSAAAIAIAAALAAALPAAAQTPSDPAALALAGSDAYVSPRTLGSAAPAAQADLAEVAADLRDERRPVKLALVLGPVGAPSLQAYANRLAARLGHPGTVLVTRTRGPVVASAPDEEGRYRAVLTGAGLRSVADPAERLARAAPIAAVAVDADDGLSAALALLGIALAGGAWAAAIGLGREGRRRRRRLGEARAELRVHLDALRARAAALARRTDLDPGGRARVEGALGTYAEVVAALQEADSPEAVEALGPRVRAGIDALAGVAAGAGAPFAAERPFEGLCTADPGHGLATARGPVAGLPAPAPVCAACRAAGEDGSPPARRMLTRDGQPVPFDAPPAGAGGGAPGVRASRA